MFNFLHTFQPQAVLFSYGGLTVHWYGLLMALAMLAGLAAALRLARAAKLKGETIIDLAFWLIIGGLLGARLYYIALEWQYYQNDWPAMLKIWQGGLSIHGGLLAGCLTIWLFAKKRQINFWLLGAIIMPAVALGQAIGRWGNYFNQELFGLPTGAPWGIPIAAAHRPLPYANSEFFHPTFLYESLGTFILFVIFYAIADQTLKKGEAAKLDRRGVVLGYLIFYSVWRLVLESFRVDTVPVIGAWRWPQIISLAIALASLGILIYSAFKQKAQEKTELSL